ncbi:MAG: type II secretion system protein [Synergistaceae bacterium]|nr:type II secretion system protein [Synergistaceae bacterium]
MRGTNRRGAFTLVELLIAIIITGFVMAAAMALLFSVFKSYEVNQDISSAKQRGLIALAAIQPFAHSAGLGLPPDGNPFDQQAFHRSFDPGLGVVMPLFPSGAVENRFTSFVQLAEDNETCLLSETEAPALWMVYAVASGVGTKQGAGFKANEEYEIQLSGPLPPAFFSPGDKDSLKSWALFPSAQSPLFLDKFQEAGGKNIIEGKVYNDIDVLPFDQLYRMAAAKIKVNNETLTIDRLDGSGAQPVVDGIAGLWCEFDRSTRLLTVSVLARADTRREPGIQGQVDGWPSAAPGIEDDAYRHAVVARTWRIRN